MWNDPRNKSFTHRIPEMELSSLSRFLWRALARLRCIIAPVVYACRLSVYRRLLLTPLSPLEPHFRHLPVFPSSTSTPTSSTRPDIRARVYNGLAGRPKMCQVHVALLGFRAPAPLARKSPTRCRANALFPHKHARVSSLPR